MLYIDSRSLLDLKNLSILFLNSFNVEASVTYAGNMFHSVAILLVMKLVLELCLAFFSLCVSVCLCVLCVYSQIMSLFVYAIRWSHFIRKVNILEIIYDFI